MANETTRDLTAAFEHLLHAEELLLRVASVEAGTAAGDLARVVMEQTRKEILQTLQEPGDAWERRELLEMAIVAVGVESVMASKAARAFAEAAEVALPVEEGVDDLASAA